MRQLVGITALAALALTACNGLETKPEPDAIVSPESPAPAAPKSDPSPDAAQTKQLIAALGAIKPELVLKEDRAVRRSVNVCRDVKAGKDDATLASNANYRFSGGTAGQLTDAQGAKIVTAVKDAFCA
ncbi:hypothetical protein ACFWWT_47650 [Streptomyces sp. NPDC058676]|uniref:hypothetical protein n=1 Tax=unclassified Streptomyces TaxID=2593676 RepID=UPI003668FC94